jgi:archaellum component FlaC
MSDIRNDLAEDSLFLQSLVSSRLIGIINNIQDARDEIERLRNNAKQDAKYLLAYHLICQKHGIARGPSDLIAALGEKE